MTRQRGGAVMLALAGLLAYLWWAGLLTDQLRGAAGSLTTPPARKPGAFPGLGQVGASTAPPGYSIA